MTEATKDLALDQWSEMRVLNKLIRFARKPPRQQLQRVRAIVLDYLETTRVKRKDEEKWVESRTQHVIVEIHDTIAEYIRTGHWKVPHLGNDRTAYVLGLAGTGRLYINELMLQNIGERAKYLREKIRCHPGPTSMIYSGHATLRYVSRAQRLPAVTGLILEAVQSRFADLIFIYRHPLDSLLSNWVFWRTLIRDDTKVSGISQIYKNTDELCAGLEENFSEFKAFAEGDPDFFPGYFAQVRGPRFLSFPEFVEETELYLQTATLALRLEDFVVDPTKEFSKIVELMSIDPDVSRLRVAPPRAKPYGYLAVKEKVPRFRNFINELDAETKKRMVRIGYRL
jgi:hypothetical protein